MGKYAGEFTPLAVRSLQKALDKIQRDPLDFIACQVDDLRAWYFIIFGLPAPFEGGFYIFRLTAPNEYPFSPPRFHFITPNGVFIPDSSFSERGKICISIGEYHEGDKSDDGARGWRASLGMAGFATEVLNAMVCGISDGINIVCTPTDAEKIALAKQSRKHIVSMNNPVYTALLAAADERIAAAKVCAATKVGAAATSSSSTPAATSSGSTPAATSSGSTPAATPSGSTPAATSSGSTPAATPSGSTPAGASAGAIDDFDDLFDDLGLDEKLLAAKGEE